MRIEKLHIKGFRNFRDEEFLFQPQTLIIGANDVGKTNLLYALRLLFDKSLNEHDLELTDSDYNVYSGTEYIEITVTISEITEECLVSIFAGNIKDEKMIAGAVIFEYKNVIHTQYMAANEEARKIGGLDLVIATIIEKYKQEKMWLDFGISTEHGRIYLNEGLISQKEGFGGRTGVYETWKIDL